MNTARRLRIPVSEDDHVLGPMDAPLELVEYGDYECPYCGAAHPVTKRLIETLQDRLKFVYRNFPLAEIHPHAMRAARAAEAAGMQDKFWEMHDMIYEHQDTLDDRSLVAFAAALELDINRFADDFAGQAVKEKIERDFESGARSGVNGTPTFYINGIRYDGGRSYEDFLETFREILDTTHKRAV